MKLADVELVTRQDIIDELGVDLLTKIKVVGGGTSIVDRWIRRTEKIIFYHIAEYSYYGIAAVEAMLDSEQLRGVMRSAVLEQVDYLITNNMVDPSKMMGITGTSGNISTVSPVDIKNYAVAPMAHAILLENGLLYSGGGR